MRALWDHERNIRDDQARACAATGGVIGINGVGIFLGENDATAAAMARHIDYAVQLVGPQHVGIGTDYVFDSADLNRELAENPQIFPESYRRWGRVDFVPPEQLPPLEAELAGRGYAPAGHRRHHGRQLPARGQPGLEARPVAEHARRRGGRPMTSRATDAAGTPVTMEALLGLKRPAEAVVSPDGSQVACSVLNAACTDPPAGQRASLWVVAARTAAAPAHAGHRDGRTPALVSRRLAAGLRLRSRPRGPDGAVPAGGRDR